MRNIHLKYYLVAALIIFTTAVAGFFINLNTTITPYSAYNGIDYLHQTFYNNANGRPFQWSVQNELGGMGGIETRQHSHQYMNYLSVQTNLLMYVLSFIYKLWEDLNCFYIIHIVFVYLGMLIYSWKILHHSGTREKFYLSTAILLSSCFLVIVHFCGNRGLLIGPFVLASYYYLRERKWLYYYISVILGCFVSEDSAMFYCTFSLYVFLFENRKAGIVSGVYSALYTLMVFMVIQPAARYGYGYEILNHAQWYLSGEGGTKFDWIAAITRLPFQAKEILAFFPVIIFLLIMARGQTINRLKVMAIVYIAPLSHWAITFITFGGHHQMHVMVCAYLAVLYLISMAKLSEFEYKSRIGKLTLVCFFVFLAINLFILFVEDFPFKWNIRWYLRGSIPTSAYYNSLAGEDLYATIKSNKELIDFVNTIPKEKSLVFWTNRQVSAFISNRSDIWMFPNYFMEADYLVVQKNAHNTFYCIQGKTDITNVTTSNELLTSGSFGDHCPIPDNTLNQLKQILIRNNHRIVFENNILIAFERNIHYKYEAPRDSVGLGFLANIPQVLKIYRKNIEEILASKILHLNYLFKKYK